MTDIDPALIEKAAKAMADDWNPERDPILTAMFRDYAQTALEAVADDLRAEGAVKALRKAAEMPSPVDLTPTVMRLDGHDVGWWYGYVGRQDKGWREALRHRADQIARADS